MKNDLLSMQGELQVFTFAIEGVPYALEVAHVLTISQDTSRLRQIPSILPGFIGLIDYQGTVVPALDFAHLLGRKNKEERRDELIAMLEAREKDHLDWLDALEHSLDTGQPFTKEKNPHKCAFGRWYDSYQPEDEVLKSIWTDFDAPHQRIHALADELQEVARIQGREEAMARLSLKRHTTLQALRRTFEFARENLRSSHHTVFLYLTSDGRTPRLALRLDDISDIRGYELEDAVPLDAIHLPPGAIPKDLIQSYLRGASGDALLLAPD
ncbi:MAG: CZB domain-containing protein, partial [Flavobacteriales bacterium]